MKNNAYTIIFVICLGIVCGGLLTFANVKLSPYRRANMEAEKVINILDVLGVPFDHASSSQQLLEIFKENIHEKQMGKNTVYVYSRDEKEIAVAVPFSGSGVWGPIEGFISLNPDLKSIVAVTFHKQEETPGLGGEIASQAFRSQFAGVRIIDANGALGIGIRPPGTLLKENEVHAVTGATMTSSKVEEMLNRTIKTVLEEVDNNGK